MYKLGLIGHPVSHSLSPVLHGAAFEHYKIDGQYQLIDIPHSDLANGIKRLIKEGYTGFNATIPHKEALYKLCQTLSAQAEQIRSVNTVRIIDGKLHGHNTDYAGLIYAIKELKSLKQKRTAIILGSGGASRGALWSLAHLGFKRITLIARNKNAASTLIEEFDQECKLAWSSQAEIMPNELELRFYPIADQNYETEILGKEIQSQVNLRNLQETDLLINAIPLGLQNCLEPDWLLPLLKAARPSFVYDMVYSKTNQDTRLVQLAKDNNIESCDGLSMLIGQAALAFEFWTGLEPPFQVMKACAYKARS